MITSGFEAHARSKYSTRCAISVEQKKTIEGVVCVRLVDSEYVPFAHTECALKGSSQEYGVLHLS